MNFKQLEYLMKVVEFSSVNKAAEHIGISQQALRLSINSLEKEMGFLFFRRSKRGSTLTSKGQASLEEIRKIMDSYNNIHKLSEWDKDVQLVVKIAATPTILNAVILTLVQRCRKKYPNLALEVHESKIGNFFPLMQEKMLGIIGSIPEGVLSTYQNSFSQCGVKLEILAPCDFQVVINKRHYLAKEKNLKLEQLKNFVIAMYPREIQPFYYEKIYEYFSKQRPYVLPQQENTLSLVASDPNAAAILPKFIQKQPYFHQRQLLLKSVIDYPMPANVCLAYSRNPLPAEGMIIPMIRKIIAELVDN